MDKRTEWWRRSASDYGLAVIDSTLRGAGTSDWDAVLQSGRNELKAIMQLLQMRTGKDLTCLEIGCGTGRLTYALVPHFGSVIAGDVSEGFLDLARQHQQGEPIEFVLLDGSRIVPTVSKPVDVAFSYEVFHYVPDDVLRTYFRDVQSLLRPGGVFYFEANTQTSSLLKRALKRVRGLLSHLGLTKWHRMPTDTGFSVIQRSGEKYVGMLQAAGFEVKCVHRLPRVSWFVAEPKN